MLKIKSLMILFFISLSISLFAQETTSSDDVVIANLVNGVESENLGLKISSVYYLGEKKAEESVIPLMKILKNDENPQARIIAALSLLKIGNEKGMFAVKRAIKFDDDEQVQRMCNIFFTMYQDQQNLK